MRISKRISALAGSATLALNAKVQELRAQGVDIIDFGAGQPDFHTPDLVKDAAIAAIRDNRTRYTAAAGLLETRQAVAHHLREEFGLDYAPDNEIVVTNGAKQALFNAIHALVDEGDEIIVPSPYWVSYPEQVRAAGAAPVVLPTEENGFQIDLPRLARMIDDRTRAIILNSPSNPTGMVYSRSDLEGVARIAIEKDIAIIADEIYGKMVYEGTFTPFASLSEEARARTIVIGAVSKTYSMTGWRIGWAAGPADIIRAMSRLQSHSTSNACTVSQWGAIAALTGDQSETETRLDRFDKRRRHMVKRLQAIDGIECQSPGGAFFVFPRVDHFYRGTIDGRVIEGSLAFAELCLESAKVALVPGFAFGADAYVRLSYTVSIEDIDRGMDSLVEFLSRIEQHA